MGRLDAGVPGNGDDAGEETDVGLEVVVAGAGWLRPNETSPARDLSSSVPDRDGLEVAPPVDSGVLPVLRKGGMPCGAGGVVESVCYVGL